jgi:Contractile injection system tube protein
MMTKVEIKTFSDKTYRSEKKNENFKIPVNPENMTRTLKIEHDHTQSRGSGGNNSKFDMMKSEELKFDFILDGTKTIENYGQDLIEKPVSEQIEAFLKAVYKMDGETHKPNFVKIIWGKDFSFDCVMNSLNISYTLFRPDGVPLRAKLSASFAGFTEPLAQSRKDDKNSPDLTHVHSVNDAEKIFNKSNQIYKTPMLYMQVARANKLVNLRSLKGVTQLIFPPLAKNEENR